MTATRSNQVRPYTDSSAREANRDELLPGLSRIESQITFLYYSDLEPVASFFENTLGLDLVVDQGWAKIYRTGGAAFLGIVAGDRGFHQTQEKNAVLITLVVDDAVQWYAYLRKQGISLLTQLQVRDEIGIRCFFFEDPGGYTFEVQQFLEPDVADRFLSPR
jgi:predicted enzyme related to lactoylglutathione lyase